jgi:hypothetical protein
MITEAIINVFLSIPRLLVSVLPTVDTQIPDGVFSGMTALLYGIAWALPLTALMPILIITFGLDIFRVIMAIIVRIKSFIPTMGD